ncbi:AraC family transcriptional regulator [Sphingobacterium corticibacter]|uniref:HTH araC/xylS-type domain-containing protein n=1 Tax=Sphingobacterium corticibacter TaxID=2171749 RepID=A0A2T8HFX9_9SPHI|nr:AraC family transcriptional regulator [Sphingobacterium corticibacter]PVH24222.1 hypothetical protein DC487_15940 [Sphingobacterium corticibacter]
MGDYTKLGNVPFIFQNFGQSWEQLECRSVRLKKPTLLIACCADSKDVFTYRTDDVVHNVSPGQTESVYLESNSQLDITTPNNAVAILLLLCMDAATDLDLNNLMPLCLTDKQIGKTTVHTSYLIKKIVAASQSRLPQSRLLYNAQIFEILYHQLTDNLQEETHQLSIHYDKVKLAKSIIHEDLSKKITIPELAKIVGTNEQYLKKYFKVYYGKTIASYTTEVKMEHARILLSSGKHLIVDVSRMTGYKHSTHFTTTFKKYYGFKPIQLK